jgi:D-serine deaminase-like pyridoxal phosphate-dependent protein
LVENYPATRFSCLVDNLPISQAIYESFEQAALTLDVFIDLNVGMNRTGIIPGPAALELYLACANFPGLSPIGLHAYDGHIRDLDLAQRKDNCDHAFAPVTALAQAIQDSGKPAPVIVAGGSPTFSIHAQREGVERSPGTFVFWDWGYQMALPEQPFIFAALVITRVISIIDSQTICLDLGHKSIAAENPLPRVHFLNAPEAQPISQSEEHLVVRVSQSSDYQLGDVFYGIPVHICPTCALYERAQVVENKQVIGTWKVVARDRSIRI